MQPLSFLLLIAIIMLATNGGPPRQVRTGLPI